MLTVRARSWRTSSWRVLSCQKKTVKSTLSAGLRPRMTICISTSLWLPLVKHFQMRKRQLSSKKPRWLKVLPTVNARPTSSTCRFTSVSWFASSLAVTLTSTLERKMVARRLLCSMSPVGPLIWSRSVLRQASAAATRSVLSTCASWSSHRMSWTRSPSKTSSKI